MYISLYNSLLYVYKGNLYQFWQHFVAPVKIPKFGLLSPPSPALPVLYMRLAPALGLLSRVPQ